MKKLVLGGLTLSFWAIGVVGCKKDEVTTSKTGNPAYVEASRSYKWVENKTKLDCSSAGKGCTVSSKYVTENSEIDLSVIQVIKLMDIGKANLNNYFTSNNLRYEFPAFYEKEFYSNLEKNKLILSFEFPYLNVTDINGQTVKIYNYESTVLNENVVQKMRTGGGYTKKIAVNTGSEGAWKCTEAGNNCKVNAVKFNLDWLANNLKYTFIPNIENSTNIDVTKDNVNNKILIRTDAGDEYGLEL